ncbi:copper resistance CopC family protein [Corynebacterium testudinoris]|uniref:Copper resistance protein CopC-like protein n=1 Tax=Corynebacterium testudinoris TaxID=136857 RepID=A0A0G3H854_9CORY|nr:copper resistance protein CopC [Corynebacterium testudinoris]AKK08940.1 copper resistance protein CopC-like protein [Corynebacterium testudinoris]
MKLSRISVAPSAVAVATAGLLLVGAPAAFAHDSVIGGDPANEAVLEEFPDKVTLEFSGNIKDDFNTFAISDVDSGDILFTGEPTTDGRFASLELPTDLNPGAGDYRIGFQITSSDGHSTRGMTTFSVVEGEAETTAPADVDSEQPADTATEQGMGTWLIAGLGIVALLGVIAMVIFRGRNNT